MSLEARIFHENGQFFFDIVDLCDILEYQGEELPELLHTSKGYAREQTAERNAAKWIAEYDSADEAKRRRLCGYDTAAQCAATERPVRPVRRRVGSGSR